MQKDRRDDDQNDSKDKRIKEHQISGGLSAMNLDAFQMVKSLPFGTHPFCEDMDKYYCSMSLARFPINWRQISM